MYLTLSNQKIKEIGRREDTFYGAGCDKLFEASSAMVDGADTSV